MKLNWQPHTQSPPRDHMAVLLAEWSGEFYLLKDGIFNWDQKEQRFESEEGGEFLCPSDADEPFWWLAEEDLFDGMEPPADAVPAGDREAAA